MNKILLLSCIGRITGSLSLLGSSSIIYVILLDRKRKLHRSYHRFMLLMSFFDIFQSMAYVFSVTALPQEMEIYGARGNSRTCQMQAFFITLGMAVPLYNSGLHIFYMLTIGYNFSPQRFAKFEPAIHITAILIPISIASIFVIQNIMIPRNVVCVPCGDFPLKILSSVLIACLLICVISMFTVCWTVNLQTAKMRAYTYPRRKSTSIIDEQRDETVKQAVSYFAAFILSYLFPFINSIFFIKGRSGVQGPFLLAILTNLFLPLQGFWNAYFYLRPGVNVVMKINPTMSFFKAIKKVIFDPRSTSSMRRRLARRALPFAKRIGPGLASFSEEEVVANTSFQERSIKKVSTDTSDEFENEAVEVSVIGLKARSQQKILDEILIKAADEINEANISSEDIQYKTSINSNSNDTCPRSPNGVTSFLESNEEHENQTKHEGIVKRMSLVKIASILNDEDFEEVIEE